MVPLLKHVLLHVLLNSAFTGNCLWQYNNIILLFMMRWSCNKCVIWSEIKCMQGSLYIIWLQINTLTFISPLFPVSKMFVCMNQSLPESAHDSCTWERGKQVVFLFHVFCLDHWKRKTSQQTIRYLTFFDASYKWKPGIKTRMWKLVSQFCSAFPRALPAFLEWSATLQSPEELELQDHKITGELEAYTETTCYTTTAMSKTISWCEQKFNLV